MSLENRRLSWQQPIQSKGQERYVYSQDQLINAIGDFRTNNFHGPGHGRIILCDDIKLDKTITINTALTIEGNDHLLMSSMDPVFKVTSSHVALRNIRNTGADLLAHDTFFVQAVAASNTLIIDGCTCFKLVTSTDLMTDALLKNNVFQGSTTAIIGNNAANWLILNNYYTGTGAMLSLGAASTRCLIQGNVCTGAPGANSNLSAGNNLWIGNLNIGLITNAGTDTLSANT